MGDSNINEEKATGLDALHERLNELSGETDSEQVMDEIEAPTTGETEVEAEVEEVTPVVKAESETTEEDTTEEEKVEEGDTEATEEKVEEAYVPNTQYKFQDEMFDFDDRVKSVIKTKEDEEYFRDLYTKQAAMEMMKTRSEETEAKYNDVTSKYSSAESKVKENDTIINYWSGLLEGLSKGDPNSVNELLALAKVDKNVLANNIAPVIADYIENPTGYVNQQQVALNNQQNYVTQNQQRQLERQQQEFAVSQTEVEVKRALASEEISEIAKYVDEKLGAGSFENEIWSEGEKLQATNPNISLSDIPNIVKSVADRYSKLLPANQEATPAPTQNITQRVVSNNTTATLPNVKGEHGVPVKPVYKSGSGLDGLKSRMKDVTGQEW